MSDLCLPDDQCLLSIVDAMGIDLKSLITDKDLISEAESFTRAVHKQVGSFEENDFDPFLKDLYTMACASVAFICSQGERRLISNQGYAAEFVLPSPSDFNVATPLDICG